MSKTTDLAGSRSEMIGAGRFAALVEGWRDGGSGPLSRRLAHVIRSRISSGLLGPGTVLPPERSLAATLGVSRSTVVAAIDELRAGGFVTSRQGSGTWVPASDPSAAPSGTTAERLLPAEHILNLAASVPPDASQLPDATLDVAELASVVPAHGYAPAGLPVLRDAIAQRHHALAAPTSPAQIHVTNGAQHALDLALGAVARRGDIIAVEDPTYVGIRDLLRGRGLRALPLPLDLIDDPGDQLSKLLIAGRARAVLLVPAVHSPTGRVRRRLQLEALARQLDTARLPTIEDNTLADLAFTGGRPPSLASLCRRAPVISVESTSKVGWGGLRVGWIRAAPGLIDATVTERERTDYGTSVPSQLVALQLLSTYDQVISRRRQALKQSAATFTRLVRKHLPDWTWQPPDGGLSAWIDTRVDTDLLLEHALRHRVAFATGPSASRSPSARTHLRACFDRPAVELEAAIIRLARAANDTRGYRSARRPPNRGHALP